MNCVTHGGTCAFQFPECKPAAPFGKWTITVEGGPAFMANAATACLAGVGRVAAGPGGIRETFLRLAAAFESAVYEPGDEDAEDTGGT